MAQANSQQGGNESFVPVSASNALELPGGPSGPAYSGFTGGISFLDGAFQIGTGNSAFAPETASAPTTAQGLRLPSDIGGGYAPALASSTASSPWLMLALGAAALVAYLFLGRH